MARTKLLGLMAGAVALAGLGPPAAAADTAGAGAPAEERSAYFITPVAEKRVASLPPGPLHWRVETFPTLDAARAAEGPHALAASVASRHWLFTLGPASGSTPGGTRVAEIGPVALPAARQFLLRINHAGGPPGAQTPVHTHPGSEAIYVLRGQVSQRTPHGVLRADAGHTLNAHEPGMVMQIMSSGTTDLEQLVMFVVDADRPFSPPAAF